MAVMGVQEGSIPRGKVDRRLVQNHPQGLSTSRRRLSQLLVALFIAAPRIAMAQSSTVVRRIGFLDAQSPPPEKKSKDWPDLSKLGWIEGRNLHIERRYANRRLETLQPLAEELIRANVEVIVANGPNPTLAAMRATTTIPIVFFANDPIGNGLVPSLARPGGNVTGFVASSPELDAKNLSLLKELVPTVQRVGMLETSGNPIFRLVRPQFQNACRSLGLEPVSLEIAGAGDIDGAIARLEHQRVQALMLVSDSFSLRYGSDIISAALKRGWPTMADQSDFVRENGALASYEGSGDEADRRLASYVDRILRGTKPADLPVEQHTQFDLVINLKVARTLGLTIPQSLLLRAAEVIR